MRIFVGIGLPADTLRALAGLQSGVRDARWINPESLHLTLRFIGEADRGQAQEIDGLLAAIRAPGFALRLKGTGAFGSGSKVRTLWAGVEPEPALPHLYGKVESAVVRAGFPPEGRKFKAHVTLARLKRASAHQITEWLAVTDGFDPGPIAVDHFTLFRSHLSGEGAHYEVLAEYPLQVAAGSEDAP